MPNFQINTDGSVTFSNVSAAPQISVGALAAIPAIPQPGAIFLALDQPKGQQLYVCSLAGQWYQFLNLGGSGGLTLEGGSLDINLAVVPRLSAANTWTGLNAFKNASFSGTVSGLPIPTLPAAVWISAWQSVAQTMPGSTQTLISFDVDHPHTTAGVTHDAAQSALFTVAADGLYAGIAQFATAGYLGAVDLLVYLIDPAGTRTQIARATVGDPNRAWDGLGAQINFSWFAAAGDSFAFAIGAGTGLTTVVGPGQTQFTLWKL